MRRFLLFFVLCLGFALYLMVFGAKDLHAQSMNVPDKSLAYDFGEGYLPPEQRVKKYNACMEKTTESIQVDIDKIASTPKDRVGRDKLFQAVMSVMESRFLNCLATPNNKEISFR